jgi:hypothetical protein
MDLELHHKVYFCSNRSYLQGKTTWLEVFVPSVDKKSVLCSNQKHGNVPLARRSFVQHAVRSWG